MVVASGSKRDVHDCWGWDIINSRLDFLAKILEMKFLETLEAFSNCDFTTEPLVPCFQQWTFNTAPHHTLVHQ